jgi:hypothetical protein
MIDDALELDSQRCHVCGHKLSKARRRHPEQSSEGPEDDMGLAGRTKDRMGLTVAGIALAVVLAATWILWMTLRPETTKADPAEVVPLSEGQRIAGLMARLAAAQSPEEMLTLVRDPQKNAGSIGAWFGKNPGPISPGGTLVDIVSRRTALGTKLCQVQVSWRNDPVLLADTPEGWRLEWRAFAGVGEMSIEECRDRHPEEPVLVLAVAQRSDYYNGPYASAHIWECLRVTGGQSSQGFYAYIPRSNLAMMQKINALPPFTRDGADRPGSYRRLALRVRFADPETGRLGLAEVVSVEGDGWFVP